MSVNADDSFLKDPRIQKVVKQLESTCEKLQCDEVIDVMRRDPATAAHIPERVKEIIEECLSPQVWSRVLAAASPSEEVEFLKKELDRAHLLLSQSQKERQDLGVKYIAVSNKIEQMIELEQQVKTLSVQVRKLEDEKQVLQQHLHAQEHSFATEAVTAQHEHQDVLDGLTDKVDEYKSKCTELEAQLALVEIGADNTSQKLLAQLQKTKAELLAVTDKLDKLQGNHQVELTSLLTKTEEEQQRSYRLAASNTKLREQLDESRLTNSRLNSDVAKLSAQLGETRRNLADREREMEETLKTTQSISAAQYANQLSHVMGDVVKTQSDLNQVKQDTKRDLQQLHDDLSSTLVKVNTEANKQEQDRQDAVRSLEEQNEDHLETIHRLQNDLERYRLENSALHAEFEMTQSELQKAVGERDALEKEMETKDSQRGAVIVELGDKCTQMESEKTSVSIQLSETQSKCAMLSSEVDTYKEALNEILKTIQGDTYVAMPTNPSQMGKNSEKATGSSVVIGSSPHSAKKSLPIWIAGSPHPCGVSGDSVRMKDWAVTNVQASIENLHGKIRELESTVSGLRKALEQEQVAKKELEGELRSHTIASATLNRQLEESRLSQSKAMSACDQLEKELESLKSDKVVLERNLKSLQTQLETAKDESGTLEGDHKALKGALSNLQLQLDGALYDKEQLEQEIEAKTSASRKLELHLSATQDENQDLRVKMGQLDSEKMKVERDSTSLQLTIQNLEMEKADLLRQLKEAQGAEKAALSSLDTVAEAKAVIAEEVRMLSASCEQLQGVKQHMDEELADQSRERVQAINEVKRLQHQNAQLVSKMEDQDQRLTIMHSEKRDLGVESDRLKQEVASLTEALGKTKQCVAEMQIQRGKLTSTVAKVAQEKGELVREKLSLMTQLAQTEDMCQSSKDKVASLEASSAQLQQKNQQLNSALSTVEKNQSSLMEVNESLRHQKDSLAKEHQLYEQQKEEEIQHIVTKKEEELQKALIEARQRKMELESLVEQTQKEGARNLSELKSHHQSELRSLINQHQEIIQQLNGELEAANRSKQNELERMKMEQETSISKFSEEKSLVYERLARLQKMYDEKCEESRHQHHQTSQLIMEQRQQLDTSQIDADRTSHEFKKAEDELKELRKKLDLVKSDAQEKISALKEQLKMASSSVSELERGRHEDQMKMKEIENKRDSLKKQNKELQSQLQSTQEEQEGLTKECHNLKVQILDNDRMQARLNQKLSHLEEKIAKTEEEKNEAKSSLSGLQEEAKRLQGKVTRLTDSNGQLETTVTKMENKKVAAEVELKHVSKKLSKLKQEKEELSASLAAHKGKLDAVNRICEAKESEINTCKKRISNLEVERDHVSISLSKLQETATQKGQADAIKMSELHSQVHSLRKEKEALEGMAEDLRIQLVSDQKLLSGMNAEASESSRKIDTLSSQLSNSEMTKSEIQSKYAKLLGILQGTLGLEISPIEEEEVDLGASFDQNTARVIRSRIGSWKTPSRKMADSPESGLGTSFFGSHASLQVTPMPASSRQNTSMSTHSVTSPSKLAVMHLDIESVKDSILSLQKRLMMAERSRDETLSGLRNLKEQVQKLESEKGLLEKNLAELQASFQSLQANHDKVCKERDESEVRISSNLLEMKKLEQKVESLRSQIQFLETDNATKDLSLQLSDTKLKKQQVAEVSLNTDNKQLMKKLEKSESSCLEAQDTILQMKSEVSSLESDIASKDTKISLLREKLSSSHQQYKESTEKLAQLQAAMTATALSHNQALSTVKKLQGEIKALSGQLEVIGKEKMYLTGVTQELQLSVATLRKEKEAMEEKTLALLQSKDECEKHADFLRNSVQDLRDQLSKKGSSQTELTNQLKATDKYLMKQKSKVEALQNELYELERQKKMLTTKVETLEANLSSMESAKDVSQELANHLEKELQRTRTSFQKLQGECLEWRTKVDDLQIREKQLDTILKSHRRQKTDLDQTLDSTNQQNTLLKHKIHNLESSITEKDHDFRKRMVDMESSFGSNLAEQVEKMQGLQRKQQQDWVAKEHEYRKRIHQLESKVHSLRDQVNEDRKVRDEYIKQTTSIDGEIKQMRGTLDHSVDRISREYRSPTQALERESRKLNRSALGLQSGSPRTSTPSKSASRSSVTASSPPSKNFSDY